MERSANAEPKPSEVAISGEIVDLVILSLRFLQAKDLNEYCTPWRWIG